MKYLKFQATLTVLVILLMSVVAWGYASTAEPKIKFSKGKLVIDVEDVRLDYILGRVAKIADIQIVVYGTANKKVTCKIFNLPTEKGLKRLLSNTDVSFIYQEEVTENSKREIVLKKVVVIGEKAGSKPVYFMNSPEPVPEKLPANRELADSGGNPAENIINSPVIENDQEHEKNFYGSGVFINISKETANLLAIQEIFSSSNTMTAQLDPELSRLEGDKPDRYGLEIISIPKGSALEKLGFQEGNIIRRINSEPVSDSYQAEEKIKKHLSNSGAGRPIRIETENRADAKKTDTEPIYIEAIYIETK